MGRYSDHDHPNEFEDDDIIEIIDIPQDAVMPEQDFPKKPSETSPLEVQRISLRARRDPKKAALRNSIVGGITGIALLVLLIFVLADTPWQQAFSIFLPARQTLSTGAKSFFYFQGLPSWGTVSLNGRPLNTIPMPSTHTPLSLIPGQYLLTWQAIPFRSYRCLLVVPPGSPSSSEHRDSCLIGATMFQFDYQPVNSIFIPISLLQLPDHPRSELIMTTQNLLNTLQTTSIIPAGDYYLGTNGVPTQAPFAFQATHRYILDTNINQPATCTGFGPTKSCAIGIQDCRLFCTLPADNTTTTDQNMWRVAAIFHSEWDYTALPRSHQKPPIASAVQDEQFITLRIRWLGNGWQVSFVQSVDNFDDIRCVTSEQELSTPDYQPLTVGEANLNFVFVSTPTNTIDCLTAVWVGNDSITGATVSPSAWLVERFGVLESGNTTAHHIWPQLPQAIPPVQSIAAQIALEVRL